MAATQKPSEEKKRVIGQSAFSEVVAIGQRPSSPFSLKTPPQTPLESTSTSRPAPAVQSILPGFGELLQYLEKPMPSLRNSLHPAKSLPSSEYSYTTGQLHDSPPPTPQEPTSTGGPVPAVHSIPPDRELPNSSCLAPTGCLKRKPPSQQNLNPRGKARINTRTSISYSEDLPTESQCLSLTDKQCRDILDACSRQANKKWEYRNQTKLIRLYMMMKSFPEIKSSLKLSVS